MSDDEFKEEVELEDQGDLTDDADLGDDDGTVVLEAEFDADEGLDGYRTVGRRRAIEKADLIAETAEGAQELLPRGGTGDSELRREVGAVLRLPEGNFVNPADIDIERRARR
jgi:hypothetical protein